MGTMTNGSSFKLEPNPKIKKPEKPLLVVVLDGWGEMEDDEYNAISRADTPCMDSMKKGKPDHWMLLKAHGTAVGLPSDDDMGNSEVGHNALGSGQVVDQGARLVDRALESGELFDWDGWKHITPAATKGTLHLIGLLSDGGVHSRYDQLKLLFDGAAERGVKRIRVHTLTDGRDCEDGTSIPLMETLCKDLQALGEKGVDARVASGGGRMCTTMDRYESDWNVVKRGYYAHVLGEADNRFKDPVEALKVLKKPKNGKPVSDQWVPAFVITDDDWQPNGAVQDGDAVVIFNFRADRVVELSKALEYKNFDKFDRKQWPDIKFAGMMQYDGELKLPKEYLVPPPQISHTTGEYLAKNGVSTFACSESQKIGHVTFFWNGNRAAPFDKKLETFHEVPSDQNIPFNEKPAMQSAKITKLAIEALKSGKYQQVRINFPNPDMVGHTGDLDATIEACTTVDACVKKLIEAVEEVKGTYLITADHGNAEDMVQRDKKTKKALMEGGKPRMLTSHTLNPVPIAIGGPGLPKEARFRADLKEPGLANVGPTIVNLLGFQSPSNLVESLLA
ncbi:Phosphoglucomutase-1 [Coccomyxa viridis]|uniref:phosphoglycerate mutase (2,3-diphosphoglycerate-independent) n=1 Tax=Coccomyxa viridis TaxID=1274662 RepID=A0AAV1I353_9CHLO|nr:Phosphoglucomutase-1 [Coccomyxa viridis]